MSSAKKAAPPLFDDARAPLTFEDIRAAARPRQTEARLCLAGDLALRAEQLEAQLEASDAWQPASLADVDPRTALASELDEIRELMRAKEVTFRFQALGKIAYSDLLAAHPPRKDVRDDGAWNNDTFPHALIAASCIEPKMTVDQVDELSEVLNQRQRNDMWGAAWMAQVGETKVPTLRAVSTNP